MRTPHGFLFVVVLVAGAAASDPGFSPVTGTAGTPVTLTGHGFAPTRAPRVDFLPSPAPEEGVARRRRARVLSFGEGEITVETPRVAPGTYGIVVTPRAGEAGGPSTLAGTFTATPPVVHSMNQETYLPGDTCVLSGVFGSRKGGRIYVGEARPRIDAWTPSTIQFTVPPLPPGEHPIYVRNRAGVGPATHSVVVEQEAGPAPAVTLSTTSLELQVPQNCHRYLQITNTGAPGSLLSFAVADDGSLGGFLEVSGGSGSLSQGQSAQVGIRVRPEFADGSGAPAGADLVVNVYTPGASNFTAIPVSVKVRSAAVIAQRALGTWTGTWTGTTLGPNNPMQAKPSSPVSGTWILELTSVDLAGETATGSITWNGSDAYWSYTVGTGGYENVTAVLFVPDRTVSFSGAKSRFWITGPQCDRFRLEIFGTQGASNPSDAFYGPDVTLDFDLASNTLLDPGGSFTTHPYNPANNQTWASSGTVAGSKQ